MVDLIDIIFPVSNDYGIDIGPMFEIISSTNLHTSVWALINLYVNDFEDDDTEKQILENALCALDDGVTPEILYSLMDERGLLLDYTDDFDSVLQYAHFINDKHHELNNEL